MKIVIDGRMLTWTGIGRYTQHLLAELQQQDTANEYHVLLMATGFKAWEPTGANFHKVLADFEPYSVAAQRRLPKLLKKLQPNLTHFTHFAVPLTYRGKYVVTIHDLTLLTHSVQRANGRLRQAIKQPLMRRVLRRAIAKSQAVITPTNFVKQQIVQRFGVPTSKITVTYEAADAISAQPAPYFPTDDHKIILYVGNAYPYKNLERLVEAFGLLDRSDCKLALVGKKDYFYYQLERFVAEKRIANVVFTDFATDAELAWLYRHASLFVFPSLSEGFGLPGLEAMQCGLPVVSSNATCLPEVYGKAAAYFDPHDPGAIADVITKVMSDKQLRQELIEAGTERVKKFSWAQMAEQTLEVYRQVSKS